MKKVLAVLLSVMMLFGALSISSSAAATTGVSQYFNGPSPVADPYNQVIMTFDLNAGTMKTGVWVYDATVSGNDKFVFEEGLQGKYIMLPRSADELKPGRFVRLPVVTAPAGQQFDGWYCYIDGQSYSANGMYTIPAGTAGQVIEFVAMYSPTVIEEDTMTKVMNILIKVFGSIIGLLFMGDEANPTEAGMQLFEQLFSGLFA